MNVDIGRSVTYPFEDEQWIRKVGTLFILSFIPGLNLMMWGGYALSVARNMTRRSREVLPGWDNWTDIAVRGLLSLGATLLYFSPALLLACLLLYILPVFGIGGGTLFV